MSFLEWGGFTPKGDSKVIVRRMKESKLFDESGKPCPPEEGGLIVSLGGRTSFLGNKNPSYLDHYIRFFSEEMQGYKKYYKDGNKGMAALDFASTLLGNFTMEYELDEERFLEDVRETFDIVREALENESFFTGFTWHDYMIVIMYLYITDSEAPEDKVKLFFRLINTRWLRECENMSKIRDYVINSGTAKIRW